MVGKVPMLIERWRRVTRVDFSHTLPRYRAFVVSYRRFDTTMTSSHSPTLFRKPTNRSVVAILAEARQINEYAAKKMGAITSILRLIRP